MGIVALKSQPNAEIIDALEELVQDAKDGRLSGVVMVSIESTTLQTRFFTAGIDDRWRLMAFLHHTIYKLQTD